MTKFIYQRIKIKDGKIKEKELPAQTWGEAHEQEMKLAEKLSDKYFTHVREY